MMSYILVTAGKIYILLFLAVGIVTAIQIKRGMFSLSGIIKAIGGLTVLELGSYVCFWGSFVFAGGPDGNFLSSEALIFGGSGIAVSFLIAIFAMRLLSIPYVFAVLFLCPIIVTIGAKAADAGDIAEAAFTTGPVFCLFIIVLYWAVKACIRK